MSVKQSRNVELQKKIKTNRYWIKSAADACRSEPSLHPYMSVKQSRNVELQKKSIERQRYRFTLTLSVHPFSSHFVRSSNGYSPCDCGNISKFQMGALVTLRRKAQIKAPVTFRDTKGRRCRNTHPDDPLSFLCRIPSMCGQGQAQPQSCSQTCFDRKRPQLKKLDRTGCTQ
jgi:hypothetical protein